MAKQPNNYFIYSVGLFWAFFSLLRLVFMIMKNGFKVLNKPLYRARPACLDDRRYGTHHQARLGEVSLHYVSNGATSKPLMLFIHGFPEFWFSWRHQLVCKAFQDKYHVVAVDQRGYGDSDKPASKNDYSVKKLTSDIKDLIEYLNYSKAVVVGHDWGGAVAWGFAQRFPQYVERLIVMNCPNGPAFKKHLQSDRKQFFMSWYMFFFQLPYLPEWMLARNDLHLLEDMLCGKTGCRRGQVTPEDIEAYKYNFGTGGFQGPMNYYRASMQNLDALEPPLPDKVTPKTLLIWGENDMALSKPLAQLSAGFCDDCTLKFVPNACHFVQQDYPEEVNSLMCEFLGLSG